MEKIKPRVNCVEYALRFETFDFLTKCVTHCVTQPDGTHSGGRHRPTITCFDVNQHYFVFATTDGLVYCFRRHVFNSRQCLKYRFISSAIIAIQLITDELLSFATQSAVYVLNRTNQKFLYGWKCPTKAAITCVQTFLSVSDQKLLLVSGDSDGCVRHHDLIRGEQSIIFKDTGFPIVQIEFIDNQTLVISSTSRSVVLTIDFCEASHSSNVTQIGKNQRKTCGKFGAVYSRRTNTVFASRPSLHLIKAQLNGDVLETIKANHIPVADCPEPVPQFGQKPITGHSHLKLGLLKMFCDDQYVLSVNDSNLVIIGTDGQFCLKEKVDQLIDVKIAGDESNEAFLLLESCHILRIRNTQTVFTNQYITEFEGNSDKEMSSESEGKTSEEKSRKGSTESLINLLRAPVNGINGNPLSYIEDELRKVFDFTKIQMRLTEKVNQLSTSIITTIDPNVLPNSDKNVFVTQDYEEIVDTNSPTKETPDLTSPLVVNQKVRRKVHHITSDSLVKSTLGNASPTGLTNGSDEMEAKITEDSQPLENNFHININIPDENCDQKDGTDEQLTDENRLEMILSAYKEANPHLETIYTDIQTEQEDEKEDNPEISEAIDNYLTRNDIHREVPPIDHKNNPNFKQIANNDEEIKVNDSEIKLKPIEHKWEPIICLLDINQIKTIEFVSLCATGYNSNREVGLIWFLPKDSNTLIYYPTLEAFKLNKVKPIGIASAANELYIVTDSGVIFKRDGMDATKPVGNKWTLIKSINEGFVIKRNKGKAKMASISVNTEESLLWCCDTNGETWTHCLQSQKWSQINDYSSHSMEMKKVCVSVTDWTIVWGIDRNGKIFVRTFSQSLDSNKRDFRGDEWLLVDGLLAKDIAVYDSHVIIVVENNQLFRRSVKIIPNDGTDEWQPVIGPDVPVDDTIIAVSVTENNDIWIMTEKGLVWHTINHSVNRQLSVKEDSDWLII
ncbi:unnamed protein product [Medioppia subpectinata]|uniref:Uncharacterized protein n=1 Tax=Medioppia subpectinata TaxID=1979941 RepID=A0A7R9KPT4_9ACAR|nr:unnamed protein product [Medioppia subpectinata]CAG2107544.1 unnamed protein product [Medioppia subpectinata]